MRLHSYPPRSFTPALPGIDTSSSEEPAGLLEAAKLCGSDESTLDLMHARYRELVPGDEILIAAFEGVHAASPGDFAPFKRPAFRLKPGRGGFHACRNRFGRP